MDELKSALSLIVSRSIESESGPISLTVVRIALEGELGKTALNRVSDEDLMRALSDLEMSQSGKIEDGQGQMPDTCGGLPPGFIAKPKGPR